jgi:hypothetical protein
MGYPNRVSVARSPTMFVDFRASWEVRRLCAGGCAKLNVSERLGRVFRRADRFGENTAEITPGECHSSHETTKRDSL